MSARTDTATALLELVHARLSQHAQWRAESRALEQAIGLLKPTGSTLRMRKLRSKCDGESDVTCDAKVTPVVTSEVTSPPPSRALPSESSSSGVSVSYEDLQTTDLESEKRAHASVVAVEKVTRDVTRKVTRDVTLDFTLLADCLETLGGATLSPLQRPRLELLAPVIAATAEQRAVDPYAMFSAAWQRFKNDPAIRSKRLARVDVFLNQWAQWLDDAPQRGLAPVSSIEEFEQEARERAAREQHA